MGPEVLGVLIPIVAIVFGVSAGMLSTWANHQRKQKLLDNTHKERLVALERGLPIPDVPKGLLEESDRPTAARALRNGVIMSLIGAILYFALEAVAKEAIGLFGLIPAAVGVGNLLYAWLLHKQEKSKRATAPDASL
jgi:hypothetical protein